MRDAAYQQEDDNLNRGLWGVSLGKTCLVYWDFGFRSSAGLGGKSDQWSFDGIIHDSSHRAQLLEVSEKRLGLHSAKL